MGVVGAFSIEAAAKHLNSRDLDGIVLGEGFSSRVIEAFLTVLAEDARFRLLPVVLTGASGNIARDLPHLEAISGAPDRIASNSLPLIRQHALAARLNRTLRSIEAGGLLDARTGLLTLDAFERDFARAISQATSVGGGLSVARFSFDGNERVRLDGARIISRLMRPTDFGTLDRDGSIVVAFSDADLRSAHMIARRLCSVMKHTLHGARERQVGPAVSAATLLPSDSPASILARLGEARRAAS
jgi:GGDEF domain-containing protein